METIGVYSTTELKKRLLEWNIASKKRWGQNFLVDKQMSIKIVHAITSIALSYWGQKPIQNIWEIGPGFGALSGVFLEQIQNSTGCINLSLFEIDYGIIKMLSHFISLLHEDEHVQIFGGNAEKSIPARVEEIDGESLPQIVCGNLPYSSGVRLLITGSKIMAFATKLNICNIQHGMRTEQSRNIPMCVMLQKEVAERLVAPMHTKQYGVSSVLLRTMYDITILFSVPATSFYPVPNVESVMCALVPRAGCPVYTLSQHKRLHQIVHSSFIQRRKILRNTLGAFLISLGVSNYAELCDLHGINLEDRAENISPDQYMALAQELNTVLGKNSK